MTRLLPSISRAGALLALVAVAGLVATACGYSNHKRVNRQQHVSYTPIGPVQQANTPQQLNSTPATGVASTGDNRIHATHYASGEVISQPTVYFRWDAPTVRRDVIIIPAQRADVVRAYPVQPSQAQRYVEHEMVWDGGVIYVRPNEAGEADGVIVAGPSADAADVIDAGPAAGTGNSAADEVVDNANDAFADLDATIDAMREREAAMAARRAAMEAARRAAADAEADARAADEAEQGESDVITGDLDADEASDAGDGAADEPQRNLTRQNLIDMATAGISEANILLLIDRSRIDFALDSDAIIELRRVGLSDAVIDAIAAKINFQEANGR